MTKKKRKTSSPPLHGANKSVSSSTVEVGNKKRFNQLLDDAVLGVKKK